MSSLAPNKVLNYGVPQGSLLGPIFDILYTKEIEEIALRNGLRIHMYADDCQIYLSFSNNTDQAEELFNQCLIQIKNWMDSNFLKLNTDKTKLKMFNPRSESVQICINFNNSLIVPSETVDILGVKLSQNINYSSFISKKVQAIYFHLRNLNHIRDSLPHSARVLLVTNLVLSKLDYCNSLLICATGKDLRPLRIMLNRAVRFIFDIRRREHITPYLKKIAYPTYSVPH